MRRFDAGNVCRIIFTMALDPSMFHLRLARVSHRQRGGSGFRKRDAFHALLHADRGTGSQPLLYRRRETTAGYNGRQAGGAGQTALRWSMRRVARRSKTYAWISWHCDALGVYSGFTGNSPDGDMRAPGGGPENGPACLRPMGAGRVAWDLRRQAFGFPNSTVQ
jgi:hypothetical protein